MIKLISKVNHVFYVRDADVGSNVNIGAGVITCNFDGINKHKTIIGNDSFIGSNTLVGVGSVITKDIPNNMLAVERNKQSIIKKRRLRNLNKIDIFMHQYKGIAFTCVE